MRYVMLILAFTVAIVVSIFERLFQALSGLWLDIKGNCKTLAAEWVR